MKKVIIVGAGFAGLNAAKLLGNKKGIEVTVIDRKNHHLFQPLLYQVAMAGLSPAEIAIPIRSLLSRYKNIRVLKGLVEGVDFEKRQVIVDCGLFSYDYLILACGAKHTYFGNNEWEEHAPGLKTIEQATEIRRRVLNALEEAERENDPQRQKQLLTFVIVGAGPTGVELAGAIGEMSRYTLARDFRNIDPKLTRIILVEAGPRILPAFSEKLSSQATRNLEKLGVQAWTSSYVTHVDKNGVQIGKERIQAATVLWAAGVESASIGKQLGFPLDPQGRILVSDDMSVEGHSEVFVAGDQAHFSDQDGKMLPGIAPVAMQQGKFLAKNILREIQGKARLSFKYRDKGQMAAIGRNRAIAEVGTFQFHGFFAWILWLTIHIYYLTGFKNRLFVIVQWAIAHLSFHKGARLIINKEWRFYEKTPKPVQLDKKTRSPKPVAQMVH